MFNNHILASKMNYNVCYSNAVTTKCYSNALVLNVYQKRLNGLLILETKW